MSSALEHIKKEISELLPRERFHLWRELSEEFDPPMPEEGEESIEAAWDEAIESRVKEVEEGTAVLISGDEMDRHIDEKLAKHGLSLKDSA